MLRVERSRLTKPYGCLTGTRARGTGAQNEGLGPLEAVVREESRVVESSKDAAYPPVVPRAMRELDPRQQ